MKRKICFITGTRADYGHLYWVLKDLSKESWAELQIIATGTHLVREYGETFKEIENDGLTISKKVDMLLANDDHSSITKSFGLASVLFSEAYRDLSPDLVVVFGDRSEQLAAAASALLMNVPIAHIHGGETTPSAVDEAIRHCLSKMSKIHFVAAEDHRKRLIQMGERPESVHLVGSPGLDHIFKTKLMERSALEKELDFKFRETNFLVNFHPMTLSKDGQEKSIGSLLGALERFSGAGILFTMPNSDPENQVIHEMIRSFVGRHPNIALVSNLGSRRYLGFLAQCDAVIGNSSSGIIEAPALGVPTVNIGPRQKGRRRADSVIDVPEDIEQIYTAINRAISNDYKQRAKATVSLFGQGNASERIVSILKGVGLSTLLEKPFFDIGHTY